MKLTINPKEVAPHLKRVERVIANKNLLSILDNFLCKVDGYHMEITGSDNEVLVTLSVPIISSDGEFAFCVSAKKFSQAVCGISSDVLNIELDGNTTMTCKHKKGHFNLSYYANTDDYPCLAMDTESVSTDLNGKQIYDIINNVSYATGTDTLHPVMTGVYFDFTEHGLVGVATDARLLVKKSVSQVQCSAMKSFIMPSKCASIVSSFIEKSDDNILVTASEKNVKISSSIDWSIIFRQINGRFPRYDAVIPNLTNSAAIVNRGDFIDSLQRALLFSPSQTSAIRLHFALNKIELIAQDMDYNMSSTEEVECNYTGNEVTIGFNGASLLLLLNNFQCEEFMFNVQEPSRAALVYPDETKALLALVMPMMV